MTEREFAVADTVLRALVATACAYEVVAITTGWVPTLSRITWRHPVVGELIQAALDVHFQPPRGGTPC